MPQLQDGFVNTVLIVDAQEWTSRSVESVLAPRGYTVLKAYTGAQALELAKRTETDLGIIGFHLHDMDGVDLVRRLRGEEIISAVTPLLMVSTDRVGRAERLEALDAGAWDLLHHPIDTGELLLRMENLVRAKHESDRLRREIITDLTTGLYNVRGVLRRAKEMGADSLRFGRSMACIAVGPAWPSDEVAIEDSSSGPHSPLSELMPGAAHAVRAAVRESDAVGQMGPSEFVIVASGLDQAAATRLADRILHNLAHAPGAQSGGEWMPEETQIPLRAGIYVTPEQDTVDPEHLLSRATIALRRAQVTNGDFKVTSFDA